MRKTRSIQGKRHRSRKSRRDGDARRIAAGYRLVFEPVAGIGFVGRAVELPGVVADGSTLMECVRATQFAIVTAVEAMLGEGLQPPRPGAASSRTEQVNIRLTPDEKAQLLEESNRRGFRGLSEFIRALARDASSMN